MHAYVFVWVYVVLWDWCLFLKCLVMENFSQYHVDECFIIIHALLGLVFKLDLCWKILYINCSFHIAEMAVLAEKSSEFVCVVLKGEQDVGGCTHVYLAVLIWTHHRARAESCINLETNALRVVQLPSIHGIYKYQTASSNISSFFQYKHLWFDAFTLCFCFISCLLHKF